MHNMELKTDFIKFDFHFYDEFQYLCMKNAFFQLLEYYEFKNPLLYLKTGFELKINVKNDIFSLYKQYPCNPFFEMDKVNSGKGSDFESIFKFNLSHLPTILLVDVFYLPFRNEFQKYHAGHFIILFDYDKNLNKVGVTDWYAPHFFKGYLDINDFIKARTSNNPTDVFETFSGKAIDNYWYQFDKNINLIDPKYNFDLNVESIKRTINNQKDSIYSGIEALQKMRDLILLLKETSETYAKSIMKDYHNQVFIYYRTSLFSKKYFEQVDEILNIPSAKKLLYFSAICYEALNNLNFLFLQNCIRFSEDNLDKMSVIIEELIKQYVEINKI